MAQQEVIAIIPARGGSKGVPRKNIRLLGGKPLIAWSIEAALKSGVVDRVFVSTEDEEIAQVSKDWGAEVPFLRPMELAQDNSIIGEATSWTVRRLIDMGTPIGATMVLYPTHPFRTRRMFCVAQQALLEGHHPFLTVCVAGNGAEYYGVAGDKPVPFFRHVEGLDTGVFHKTLGLLTASQYGRFSGRCFVYEVNDPVQLIDLDTELDFRVAEAVLTKGMYDFENN